MTAPKASRPRVGFLTPWDIEDDRSWSGIIRPMYDALSSVFDVVPISTHDVRTSPVDRLLARGVGTLTSKNYLWDFGIATAVRRGRIASRRVEDAGVDAVFAVAASVDLAYLAVPHVPVVQYVDATFESVKDAYPVFARVHALSAAQVVYLGNRADRRTTRFVTASQWALHALAHDHAIGTESCVIAPPGAAVSPQADAAPPKERSSLRYLLVASDWVRKGGDRAVRAVQAARDAGADVELVVVGDTPDLPDWVLRRGRLGKAELSREYADADVLLELAHANAAGVVLTDAAAHGLPAIATATMGVPTIVAHDRSGWLIDPSSDIEQEASLILQRLDRTRLLEHMRSSVRKWYDESLSWPVWAERVESAILEATKSADRVRR